MSTLVPAFNGLLTQWEASETSSGVILAACRNFSKDWKDDLKRELEQQFPAVSAHCAYDHHKQILGILLERQTLGNTHFYALVAKDYLVQRGLLSGSLVIAELPPNAAFASQVITRMIQEKQGLEGSGDINIYDHSSGAGKDEAARILLVNHDETVNEFLSIYLKRKGYQVTVAHDGMEGIQKFRDSSFDLIITDLNLPVINGYQLMERISHLAHERMSKIVVLTDKRLEEDVQKSFALGASDYITKPFSPVELEARVKRLIS